jgi:error-prone DNA polymerase
MSTSAVETIVRQRDQHGPWNNFEQFARDCELARDAMTALAASDLFKNLGASRADALWKSEAAPYKPMLDQIDDAIDWKPEAVLESIQKDFRSFKTSLKKHPAEVIKRDQWPYPVGVEKFTSARLLNEMTADSDVFAFGMVLVKQSPGSAKGMVFVTLEDETGFINLAFTPQVYTRFYRQVDQQPFLCVVGRLQRVHESHSILVKRVFDYVSGASLLSLRQEGQAEAAEVIAELIKPRAFR